MERVAGFLRVAESVGVEKGEIPGKSLVPFPPPLPHPLTTRSPHLYCHCQTWHELRPLFLTPSKVGGLLYTCSLIARSNGTLWVFPAHCYVLEGRDPSEVLDRPPPPPPPPPQPPVPPATQATAQPAAVPPGRPPGPTATAATSVAFNPFLVMDQGPAAAPPPPHPPQPAILMQQQQQQQAPAPPPPPVPPQPAVNPYAAAAGVVVPVLPSSLQDTAAGTAPETTTTTSFNSSNPFA